MVFTIFKVKMNPKAFEDVVTAPVILSELLFLVIVYKADLEHCVAVRELYISFSEVVVELLKSS